MQRADARAASTEAISVDWFDPKYYAIAPEKNPKGPETGTQRSFRGGGWVDSTPSVRGAQRNGTDPNTKMNWMGFRCARDVQGDGQAPAAKPMQTSLR